MGCIENITNVVNLIKKGRQRNTWEKYYMYNETRKMVIKLMTKTRFLIIFYRCNNIGWRQLKILICSPCFDSNVIPRYPAVCCTYCFTARHARFSDVILSFTIRIYAYLQYPSTLPLFTKSTFCLQGSLILKHKRTK
jgi:hypothetical protein